MTEHLLPTTLRCPYCERQFASQQAMSNHVKAKRRTSAAHGLDADGEPRKREDIDAAVAGAGAAMTAPPPIKAPLG